MCIEYLSVAEGRIAYARAGSGPLVVLAPGMGDLRATYRFLVPLWVAAGFEVVATDLRGHGDSDVTFGSYGDSETACDLVALIEHLGPPAIVVGNSMSAGSAVIAAAQRPDLVRALVLLGPFVRDGKTSALDRALFRLALVPLWAARVWHLYLPALYVGRKPDDFAAYRRQVVEALRRPGYAKAFSRTARTSHAEAESLVGQVHAPALVVMGAQDPDFADPVAEAKWVAGALGCAHVMIEDAGHYPQSQQPAKVWAAIQQFLKEADLHA